MKVYQKVLTLVIVVALALTSLGWIAGIQGVHAPAFAPYSTGAAQVGAVSGSNAGMASILPLWTIPGPMPNVSWNG